MVQRKDREVKKKFFEGIDWKLLRKQKADLLSRIDDSDPLMGIVHLIDNFQDYAVDELAFYSEEEVFGEERSE